MTSAPRYRPAWVEVDLEAVRHNAALLARLVAPARLCAVVKADAYGHGAPEVAMAAAEGGASLVAVALVEEGVALRAAGVEGEVLLLSEPPPSAMEEVVRRRLTPTLYRHDAIAATARAAKAAGRRVRVQLKVDTGMHRVGADPGALLELARAVLAAPELELAGLWTHLAVAEDPDDPFTDEQLARFEKASRELAGAGIEPGTLHAANSAGAIAHPGARYDLVRCGIALYGHLPSPALAGHLAAALGSLEAAGARPAGAAGASEPGRVEGLRPVLSWKAQVHLVRHLEAGERPSYGRTYELARPGMIGVVPVGYHDGVPRAYGRAGGEVLIGGKRRKLAGTVTMDQVLVDLGDDCSVRPGDEVVLIGRQGAEEITVPEWAERLGTIPHEVLCGIGPRVPRRYLDRPG